MGSRGAQELTTRASALRSLADEIEALPDQVRTFATQTMKDWSGPNADRTRGDLGAWRTKCRTVADILRGEARTCEQKARDLK